MMPFTPITTPQEVEFFSVIDYIGEKCVHLHGYTYESDSEEFVTEDNPDGTYWANMEACGIVIPLDDFIKEYKERGMEYANELYEDAKQYQGDYTDEEIVEVINHYYRDIVFPAREDNPEGYPDAWLCYGEITDATPYGQYIC